MQAVVVSVERTDDACNSALNKELFNLKAYLFHLMVLATQLQMK